VTGVVLLAFVVYLFLPHIVFKTAAELFVDLGRKQNASQVEEIVAAVLPSSLLHLLTLAAFRLFGAVTSLNLPPVDSSLIATAASGDSQKLTTLFAVPQIYWTAAYVIVLLVVAAANGAAYGRSRYIKVLDSADARLHPEALQHVQDVNRTRARILFVSTYIWHLIYAEYHVALHRWAILSPWVFVKAKEGQLLHGRFLRYDRSRNGEIEAITLSHVSRYTRLKVNEVLARGVNPISRLEGEIYIKWAEIVDINVTTPVKLSELWEQYERERLASNKSEPAG
jgi:hypothetical protein